MERLTDRDADMICKNEDCGVVEEYCPLCSNFCEPLYHALQKLKYYEDLEEQLEKVYGECDGLLETAINSLVRHEGAEIGTPAKARLLTDEDVDKWLAWKDAEEQGLLLRLPCKVGDTVWNIDYIYECKHAYNCPLEFDNYKCEANISCRHEYKVLRVKEKVFNYKMLEDIGKTVFLTKEEAEQALAKMKEGV